ncbi:MAG TPA: serine/threonine-protein kinase [Gemmatimonadaceae bacterium]|jgi:serine/threonine-protein kinase
MTVLELPTPDPRTFDDLSRPFVEAIAARYAVKRVIGQGGMGIVYLARDRRLDRLVAVKTLLPHLAADTVVRERFLRETRTAGAMAHPNIVPIHGADEIEGHVFFVMGLVDGESLAAHMHAQEPLPQRAVVGYLRDVASALSHAHQRGIIHRDIKAENILIERATGRALVTDFGIARLAEAAPLTATGQMLGTVYYASPEQVSGERIDARSDLYSLGVVAFLALTGRFPFSADVASAVLVAHVTKAAPSVTSMNPSVAPALAAIVDRCLAKQPDERFRSADELLAALDAAVVALDRPSGVVRDRLVSDTEAQAIWRRAAELQSATGVIPRPEIVPRMRDTSADRVRASGFRVDDVRAAADEAGIAAAYVDHALAEHGLVSAGSAPSTITTNIVSPVQHRSLWSGAPLDVVKEAVIDGEIQPRDFDRLINTLRDGTGRMGVTTAKSRELGWRCGSIGHPLDVSVVPDKGKTTIRLARSVRRMTATSIAGSLIVGGGVVAPTVSALIYNLMLLTGPSWFVTLSHHAIDTSTIGTGLLVAALSIPVARRLARWRWKRADAGLDALAMALADKVRDSIGD